MPAFGGLPENLASFCSLLRREHGFRIGAGELLDAARALDLIDVSSPQTVRAALRAVLAGTRDDVLVFDAAFDRFFLSGQATRAEDRASTFEREVEDGTGGAGQSAPARRRATDVPASETEEAAPVGSGPMLPLEAGEEEGDGGRVVQASYSPVGVESLEGPEVSPVDEAWVAAARALVRRVQLGPSRKWRPSAKGRRFDLRRTLRSSLQTGGETLAPRWLARPRRQPRFIVLVDGSRSMSQYSGTSLKLASALARATSRVEVFVFSTALQRVTTDVRRASVGNAHRLRPLSHAWGGGTTIGACLAEFLRRFGERLLSANAVVIVASDGLDVGEPGTLRAAMQTLRRRSGALVWLNPLLETPGYEPAALGMSVARPFVTTFSSVNDLAGFVQLARGVRIRR
jgi:uncharacterized protein